MKLSLNIKLFFFNIIIITLLLIVFVCKLPAHEFSGNISLEGWYFPHDPLYPEQKSYNFSFALQPEYFHEFDNRSSLIIIPFARFDLHDSNRTHMDIREFNYLWVDDPWELRVGIGKVFWGTTESVHLVDIINQTDLVEGIDGEDKLGQPMVNFSISMDWGFIDLFVLPYFRERTFVGKNGRLRSIFSVDTKNSIYESSQENTHIDFAFRYSHSLDSLDIGLSHFIGTGREPTMILSFDGNGLPFLVPYYEQINQTGLDLQMALGKWLWKAEAIYRTGQGNDFFASASGFEYTIVGIFDTALDIGIIGEWLYDERGCNASTPFDNDIMTGLRLTFNDINSSQILLGVVQNLNKSGTVLNIEASSRLGDNIKIIFESNIFIELSNNDPLYALRDDSYFRLALLYYF